MPKRTLSESEVGVITAALLSAKEVIVELASDEEMMPELVRGIIIGVSLGVPQQIRKALEILGASDDQQNEDDQNQDDEEDEQDLSEQPPPLAQPTSSIKRE